MFQAAEELVEGIVMGGGKQETIQEMRDLVLEGKWKTKKSKTKSEKDDF